MNIEIEKVVRPERMNKILSDLQRSDLEHINPSINVPLWGEIEGIQFWQIRGITSFWEARDYIGSYNQMQDLLTGLNGLKQHFYFLILNKENSLSVFMGAGSRESQPDLVGMLTGAFPGIEIVQSPGTKMGSDLEKANMLRFRGMLTGAPATNSNKGFASESGSEPNPTGNRPANFLPSQLERLIRGLHGTNWGFFIHANPVGVESIQAELNAILNTTTEVHSSMRLQMQKLVQETVRETEERQTGSTTSISGERLDRQAQFVISVLEAKTRQYQNSLIDGGWNTETHFFSDSSATLQRMQSMLRSIYRSGSGSIEPIRTKICVPSGQSRGSEFSTFLSSEELSCFAYFPKEEVIGYRIKEHIKFDVDQEKLDSSTIDLGLIIDGGRQTSNPYCLPIDTLASHAFVSGITGSGKTTTVKHILKQLFNNKPMIPFLVIEPSKSEYRDLLTILRTDKSKAEVKVYTLGDETVSPLRINPFQFEVFDGGRFLNVQTHIDYLRTVFSAAFVLYPPMPYVLEICLHEIYTDRGWDLATNTNVKLPQQYLADIGNWPVFPTLEDLHRKVDQVTSRLGYDYDTERDVKAALQTRLESLMVGSKGMMLNTPIDEGMKDLLNTPCVVELERIGDDEQKAFIMGILLTRLFEYRKLQKTFSRERPVFQHLTVVEEAHRLLRASSTKQNSDQASPGAQAIETFANLLAEVRAYGEGILMVEQIPSKLIPDAIKNSNLKIMHRLVPEDDREVLSAMSNMTTDQSRFLVTIPRGEAVVFNQGDDHPLLVKINPEKQDLSNIGPTDEMIRIGLNQGESPAIRARKERLTTLSAQSQGVRKLIKDDSFQKYWHTSHLLLLDETYAVHGVVEPLIEWAARKNDTTQSTLNKELMEVTRTYSWQDAYARGIRNNWKYDEIEIFSQARTTLFGSLFTPQSDAKFDSEKRTAFLSWLNQHTQREVGPYIGCQLCRRKCVLRHDSSFLVNGIVSRPQWKSYLESNPDAIMFYDHLCNQFQNRFFATINHDFSYDLLNCVCAMTLNAIAINENLQMKVAEGFLIYNSEFRGKREIH